MKYLITLVLLVSCLLTTAQTTGEIQFDTTGNSPDAFPGYNSFLRSQPEDHRTAYYSNEFDSSKEALSFFTVMNVSSDTVKYYDGSKNVKRLAPYHSLAASAGFDENGLLVYEPDFAYVVNPKSTSGGLFIVKRACINCIYYREGVAYEKGTKSNLSGWRTYRFRERDFDSRILSSRNESMPYGVGREYGSISSNPP
jgi:hypothetical protein